MTSALLVAARSTPYRRAAIRRPLAINKTGYSVIEGQTTLWPNSGDSHADDGTYSVVGSITGPLTAADFIGNSLQVTADTDFGGDPLACSIPCRLTTPYGSSDFTMSGTVQPLAPTTATIVGQWELSADVTDSVGTANGAATGAALFGQPTIPVGGVGGMALAGGYATKPPTQNAPQTAAGLAIYLQPTSQPAEGTNRQIANRDATSAPNGWTLEQWTVGGVSMLNGYIRDDAGSAAAGRFAATGVGAAALPVGTGAMIAWTFDPASATKCRLYLRLAGGSLTEVASIADNGGTTLANNVQNLLLGIYGGLVNAYEGGLQRLILWSGAPSSAELAALPAPQTITVTLPTSDPPVAVDYAVSISASQASLPTNPATQSGEPSATVTVTGNTLAHTTAVVGGDSQTITLARNDSPGFAGADSGTVTYQLATAGGTDTGVITVTVAAVGTYTPFAFQTSDHPPISHPFTGRPPYSASDPRSAAFIDPMTVVAGQSNTGLPIFRLTGDPGTTVFINGNQNSGLKFPYRLRNDNAGSIQKSFNSDGTLLMIDWYRPDANDPANPAQSLLFDINGSHGASGPWRIIRASASDGLGDPVSVWWVWDPNNPLRAFTVANNGSVGDWWPIGAVGHAVGERNVIRGAISGYSGFWGWNDSGSARSNRHSIQTSHDGRYWALGCRRNSDGRAGAIRVDLTDGSISGFIPHPYTNTTWGDGTWMGIGTSPDGGYTTFQEGGAHHYLCSCTTGAVVADSANVDSDGLVHPDWLVVNGVNRWTGPHTNHVRGFGTDGTMKVYSNTPGGNPNHAACRNMFDRYETFGAAGGATSGVRYVIYARSGDESVGGVTYSRGIIGIRTGPNDLGQHRWICNHRGNRTSNYNEIHPSVSFDGRMVLFPSNWQVSGGAGNQVNPYIVELPDAWWSPDNTGLT